MQGEADWLGSCSAEKLLEILGDNKLHMNKWCTLDVMKANGILGHLINNISTSSSSDFSLLGTQQIASGILCLLLTPPL